MYDDAPHPPARRDDPDDSDMSGTPRPPRPPRPPELPAEPGSPAAPTAPARQRVLQVAARHACALADPIRLAMLEQLQHGSFSVRELAAVLTISEPAASRHAALLLDGGLIERERHGRQVICRRRGDEAEWRSHVINLLGSVVEPKLPVIWTTMQRLASGTSLDGLALPRAIIEAPARLTG